MAGSVSSDLRTRLAVPALVVWTLFVWGGRLRNLAADPGGFGAASRWSLWGSIAFVALALGVVVTRYVGPKATAPAVLGALCALTIGVWVVRGIDIALGDHSVGFVAVHVVLAGVSIGLAALALISGRDGVGVSDRSRSIAAS